MQNRTLILYIHGKGGANLTVMENGEHWFHTLEQMEFLDAWLMNYENAERKSV